MNEDVTPSADAKRRLRVLLVDGQDENLELVAGILTRLGHEVVARETDIEMVGVLGEREPPDVAIVIAGDGSEYALALIRRIVHEATFPVILLIDVDDTAFVDEAARLGVFACLTRGEIGDGQLERAFAVVLHRFAEYHALQGAFGRRAVTERAKGIHTERHSIDEQPAFEMLRERSRISGRKITDVAQAVIEARSLLPRDTDLHEARPERERGD